MSSKASSRRFASREHRELRRELLIPPLPELGLVAAGGPNDPPPELEIEDGVVTRLDGKAASEFDVIDRFVVAHGLDLAVAEEEMRRDDVQLARMLVDVDVPRDELVRIARSSTRSSSCSRSRSSARAGLPRTRHT